MKSPIFLHRAPWLIPVNRPPIANGAVAVAGNRILCAGSFATVHGEIGGASLVDHPDMVLLPGLVNGHIHLELSHLDRLSRQDSPGCFTQWIAAVLACRNENGTEGTHVADAARQVLAAQLSDGVCAVADIGNTSLGSALEDETSCRVLPFVEYLGLSEERCSSSLARLADEADEVACTAHAPYSTHARLIQYLKKRANRLGHCFPLHVAESAAETEMMCRGTGEFPDFLRSLGTWDNSFQPTGIDKSGSVRYLHQLGVLDRHTLCVHGVHVSIDEIELLARAESKVCLCPGSNRYLGVGKAPVANYLRHGILPALGTDSLASNPKLSLWREMQLLAEDHPGIHPADILAMATLGGAQALGIAVEAGSIEQGKQAMLIGVALDGCAGMNGEQVLEFLVTAGSAVTPQWLNNGREESWPA